MGRDPLGYRDHHTPARRGLRPLLRPWRTACSGHHSPHGWKIHARHGSQILTIENTDQYLAPADVDTKNEYLDTVQAVDWSQPNHIDIAANIEAPQDWNRKVQPRHIYLSLHVDYTE